MAKIRNYFFLMLFFFFTLPIVVKAESGQCGRQMNYSYDETTKVLTLSGSGDPYSDYTFSDTIRNNTKTIIFSNYSSTTIPLFSQFVELETISIPIGVKKLQYYSEFDGCVKLKNVALPNTLESIDYATFKNCKQLSSIIIPDSVKKIGWFAFQDCSKLDNVIIPEGVTEIIEDVFRGCTNLRTIKLPSTLKKIGCYAFYGCSNLESIIIPLGVDEIYFKNFHYCTSLNSIIIPNTVTKIDNDNFDYCPNVTIVGAINSNAQNFAIANGIPFTEHNHTTKAFSNNGDEICSVCGQILHTTIKDATIKLEPTEYTYSGEECRPSVTVSLGSVVLNASTDYDVSYSNNVEVGTATVTVTGKGAYIGTATATFQIKAKIPNKNTAIKDASGKETGYVVSNSDKKNLTVEYVGKAQDKKKTNLSIRKKFTDKDGNVYTVTSIRAGVFKNNKKLKKLTIPNTITKIGKNAFKDCKNLKKIIIYANPKLKIGKNAFKNISKDAVIILKGVTGKQKDKIIKDIKKQTNARIE